MRRTQRQVSAAVSIAEMAFAGWIAVCFACTIAQDTHTAPPTQAARKGASDTTGAAKAESKDKDGGAAASGKAGKRYVSRSLCLQSQKHVDTLLAAFPDISDVTSLYLEDVRVQRIPDELLAQISLRGENIETLCIRIRSDPPAHPEGPVPEISDAGMEYISRHQKLHTLSIAARFSATGLAHLAKLPELHTLGLKCPTVSARELFEVVSKMPKIESLGIYYADFSRPIDAATHKAIASLNGRLEVLSFGEWGETTIHASLIPAIAEIESLTALDLGEVRGSVPHGIDYYLRRLPYLERLTPDDWNLTLYRYLANRGRYPVQFRKVESASEMMVLLQHLLGEFEARKVRREVVRRRAGLSKQSEDFTKSKQLLQTILKDSFGVTVYDNATRTLGFIRSQYPEIDEQIRRYLSGQDVTPKK